MSLSVSGGVMTAYNYNFNRKFYYTTNYDLTHGVFSNDGLYVYFVSSLKTYLIGSGAAT